MPTVWRITKKKHSKTAFAGQGARMFGGRWNSPGTSIVYTAQSQSLAILETLVHLKEQDLLTFYVLFSVEVPEDVLTSLDQSILPKNWKAEPPPQSVQMIGDAWANSEISAVLSVPSALVPGELNYLLNPQHPHFSKLKIGKPIPFQFDPRFSSKHR